MKTTVRILIALTCAMLLALASFPTGMSENTTTVSAAQGTIEVAEVEPNDDPFTAQDVPFPAPGETIVISGDAADGDDGFFSEEAETFFAFAGGFGVWHDVYVLDPSDLGKQGVGDGPVPMKFEISWVGEQDLDVMVGTQVDDFLFFFDGYKILSDVRMTTLRNPEAWPRSDSGIWDVALYFQPEGVTVDGNPIPNDGFARNLMLIVKNFDAERADYTLTIEHADGHPNEAHQVDDGGLTNLFFTGPNDGILLNAFTPSRFPATLTAIQHGFVNFSDVPDPTGQPIRVLVIAGDDPLAPPPSLSEADVLFDEVVPIPGTISPDPGVRFIGAVNDIPIDPPITIESGSVYVGMQWPSEPFDETGVTLAIDTQPAQYLVTYFSNDGGENFGRTVRTEDLSGEDVFTNANIRAVFEFENGDGMAKVKTKPVQTRVPTAKATLSKQALKVKPINR